MNLDQLEAVLRQDTQVFDHIASPIEFRENLGRQLRRMDPPAPPKPERYRWLTVRNTFLAAAAGIAIVFGLSLIEPPHDPAGLATAVASAEKTVTAIPETASAIADRTYELEIEKLKADASTFSSPFRSAVPSKAFSTWQN